MTATLERHAASIQSTLSCFDRLLIQGTVVDIGHPDAIRFYFNVNRRRIFDFKEWAKPYRDRIHDDVKAAAAHAGLKVEFVKRPNSFRKEDRIAEILKTRGTAPGVVHVFEVMENCMTYEPWHDKASHRTYFRTHGGKCAHYYVYFIKRLRTHGIVKKVAGAFRYYLTTFGKAVVASALKLKEMFLVPSLRGHLATP